MALMGVSLSAMAIDVINVRHAGPHTVAAPIVIDSLDVNAKALSDRKLIDTPIALDAVWSAPALSLADSLTAHTALHDTLPSLHLLGFTFESTSYQHADVTLKGLTDAQLYVDGSRIADMHDIELLPTIHKMVVKYVAAADTVAPTISITSRDSLTFSLGDGSTPHLPTLDEMFTGWRYNGINLSADGRWYMVNKNCTLPGGEVTYRTEIRDTKTHRLVSNRRGQWMPTGGEFYYTRQEADKSRTLVAEDPATGEERILGRHLPEGTFNLMPGERYLVFSANEDGPAERSEIAEVLNPEDRQPGWRKRSRLSLHDLTTGLSQPLTYGYHSAWLYDATRDGRRLIIGTTDNDYTVRPSQRTTLLMVTLPEGNQTEFTTDTLVWRDGFVADAQFSPDGKQVLLRGSAEAFNRIGCTLPADRTPNGFEYQLFAMDLSTPVADTTLTYRRAVRPLTRQFDPSPEQCVWSAADNQIYMRCEDRDCVRLFRLDPTTLQTTRLDVPEDVTRAFSISDAPAQLMCYGESAINGPRLYSIDTRRNRATRVEDLDAPLAADWKVGTYHAWQYDNGCGDSICCGYCLPADFDPSRQYPVIVHYYGGCSPTSRYFVGAYSPQFYAAHGYIALIVNPSGAAGFGQEFGSRHVATAGQGVADDIIGASRAFCRTHAFADSTHVGCISASYGGFMTQYMLTETDFFATGVSHAGISSHAGYWGEGYWGYSYSEVSMGDLYPWTAKDLYVNQSPLFRADRIHKPLLFTHGSADTNVPPSESIQMFTALKRTGCPTALLMVDGENHHILNYDKRTMWLNSIMAWFDRWLKDEPAWWNSLYPEKQL